MDERPGHDPGRWGIDAGYEDVHGRWHDAPASTVRIVLEAMGAEPIDAPDGSVRAGRPPPPVGQDLWVVKVGAALDAGGRYTLVSEDGSEHHGAGRLPPDLPLGYHTLHLHQEDRSVRLVVSPGRCAATPAGSWGWAAQIYALSSAESWGMGDFADLERLARWSAGLGAEVVVVNPLHAPLPVGPQQASPYYPASRVFRSPLYLRPERVDGAAGLDGLDRAVAAGRALGGGGLVDRDAVWAAKQPVLEAAFRRWSAGDPGVGLDAYRHEVGPSLDRWAAFCAAAEAAGGDWRSWPASLATPEAAVAAVAADPHLSERATFHAWLQWQVDLQLAAAGSQGVGLVQDLAIGCDPAGADAWLWQDAFADGLRVGAPPDLFAPEGQDWGLPPFDPWRLRQLAFEPFVDIVRAGLRHAGGLRVDHVMGLFRLFWIPVGGKAADGCYVRYPWQELLDVLALESVRAGAFCVGEDLGTVEPWVREQLADRRVLSTRLLWFEDERPGPSWPVGSMAAVTTHDLPTVVGAWTGADLDDQRAAGLDPAEEPIEELAAKLSSWAGLERGASPEEAVLAAHRLLAAAPSALVTATLDDALGVARRPNLPGTTDDQRHNWRIPLPVPLEQMECHPLVLEVARLLAARPAPAGAG
ncbi:MAG: 4-alpha-glucanotransferase [Acidimicrobiales bacterium]